MKDDIDIAMRANLEIMQRKLGDALGHVADALYDIRHGERNSAIGAMPGTEELLRDALALYRATIALHRAGRSS